MHVCAYTCVCCVWVCQRVYERMGMHVGRTCVCIYMHSAGVCVCGGGRAEMNRTGLGNPELIQMLDGHVTSSS